MVTQKFTEDGPHPMPPAPHGVEREVRRSLLSQHDLTFTSLVVRRIENGVCLEGIVETDADRTDADRLAAKIAGVNDVMNRLVVCRRPLKG